MVAGEALGPAAKAGGPLGAAVSAVGPLGGLQCAALQAEVASVMVAETTSNGIEGSRVSSRGGTRLSSGATGACGWENPGRSKDSGCDDRDVCGCTGEPAESGAAAAGSAKWSGRSAGAYSGPSSHVAMPMSLLTPTRPARDCTRRVRELPRDESTSARTARTGATKPERSVGNLVHKGTMARCQSN